MMNTERSQTDGKGEEYSDLTGLDTGDEMITRQEFKDEADIGHILKRYGMATPLREMVYGKEVDDSIDLQTAYQVIEEAKKIMPLVPEELRQKYPTWQSVLNAAYSGEYAHDLAEVDRKKAEAIAAAERRVGDVKQTEVTPNS